MAFSVEDILLGDTGQPTTPEKAAAMAGALKRQKNYGLLGQMMNLQPTVNVGRALTDQAQAGLKTAVAQQQANRQRASQALARVGLAGRERHTPGELSGGQQQRVAIARAIVTQPMVVLADEPTGNLDTRTSHEIMDLLQELNREEAITVIMVTHEADMAAYAHRIIHFIDGHIAGDAPGREAA